MIRFLLLSILILPALACSAHSAPVGIGFVQAEEGTWWCRAATPAEAFGCAQKKCASEGNGQECHATRWCSPAGWSGVMVVWLSEFHSTVPLCGAPTSDSAKEAVRSICTGFDDGHRCDLIRIIDPDGKEQEIEGVVWPGVVLVPGDADAPAEEKQNAKP